MPVVREVPISQAIRAGARDGNGALIAYRTALGRMIQGRAEDVIASKVGQELRGQVQLIFTSPPFPLNKKKKYGNLQGDVYVLWLASFAKHFRDLLKPNGSIVLELGNAWESGHPIMSTLALRALLGFLDAGELSFCQQFVCHNPARLPSPAQWVTIERIRVKDSYTHVWWMSPTERPKADNHRVLRPYSKSMRKLIESQSYNTGKRPSEHHIGKTSFLKEHPGAIPSNALASELNDLELLDQQRIASNYLEFTNTNSTDTYQQFCRDNGLEMHPARMSPSLPNFFINFLTEPGDLVLDPFAGSNTTGAVAERLGRRWAAFEPEAKYVASSRGRFPGLGEDLTSVEA